MKSNHSFFYVTISLFFLLACNSKQQEADLTISPKKGVFKSTLTTTGELKAQKSTNIYGPRNARQAGIYQVKISDMVPEGTIVQEGAYVAQLDQSELSSKITDVQLAIQKAQSQYEQATLDSALTLSEARNNIINLRYAMQERQYEMDQSAFEAPATQQRVKLEYEKAQRAYDQAVGNYQKRVEQAIAKVKEVESDLKKQENKLNEYMAITQSFTVTAPANGMVIYYRSWDGKRKAGSTVNLWNPVIATLPDLSIMESVTFVNEVDVQKIKSGQEVAITLDANPDKALVGKVTEVANIGEQHPNSDSKVFEVKIIVNGSDTTLRPAMTTGNEILLAQEKDAISIPLECLHAYQDSISYVFKEASGAIVRQEVQTGIMNEDEIIIKQGISETDKIFLSVPQDTAQLSWKYLPPANQTASRD